MALLEKRGGVLVGRIAVWVALVICLGACSGAGSGAARAQALRAATQVTLTVVDENHVAVSGAQVTLTEPGRAPRLLRTDYAGNCSYSLAQAAPYELRVDKPNFYETLVRQVDPAAGSLELVLAHEQIVREQVNVVASSSGIDPEQTSDTKTMNTPEIVNIPYPTTRDIRNLLPFFPGIVQDGTGQVHVAGSETYATLDTMDGFDIRSPASGTLALRVSADAVRSIDAETTRYPAQYGKATGGVIAFFTGMGDDKFRFNTTDFLPSYEEKNGLRFDKFVPRFTFSGPIEKGKAWFLDGLEIEYDSNYIVGLPAGADTDPLLRGSNLAKAQVNWTPHDSLVGGLLFNDYHAPYDGLSTLMPQESTVKHDTIAWFPYLREQHGFPNGALLDVGAGYVRIHDGYEPHGDIPFEVTPETTQGSYFESATGISYRVQQTAVLYLPPGHWLGRHEMRTGIDINEIRFGQEISRAPINYLRENGTLLRQSVFPAQAPFTRSNLEIGAYLEDHWLPRTGLAIDPGIRFDWDEILRRPLYSPRLALAYSPGTGETTKLVAGAGLYYEHTQLQYLEEALAGVRYDTYYDSNGIAPITPPLLTSFVANPSALHEARVFNWSVGVERKLPASTYASVNFLDKHGVNEFVYASPTVTAPFAGIYPLTNGRQYDYRSVDLGLKHTFAHGYVLFGSYTRSSAHTNAALEYSPGLSVLGAQQSGPLPWNVPNRVLSWGWLPVPRVKNWDFVYTLDWHDGFPFTSVNDNREVVGQPGSRQFPDFLSFSPGLEWRFHFRGKYFGLRGVIENITDSSNPLIVNNCVDSPEYGMFSEPLGRALTARIRLIGSK